MKFESMEPQMFDNVKFEKEKAVARFNRFRRVLELWRIFKVLVVFGLISWWCSARAPAVFGGYFVEFSSYLFNHHVVFLIGNAIIVFLLMLCRENDLSLSGGRGFYDDYVKYSEAAAHQRDGTLPPQQYTEDAPAEETKPSSQCDDVAAAIEKATRQIERFQRTQSEILKREIAVRRTAELRRSETENRRKAESGGAADIEALSSEEFRRRVDDFIDTHWTKRKTTTNQLEEFENDELRLGKIA